MVRLCSFTRRNGASASVLTSPLLPPPLFDRTDPHVVRHNGLWVLFHIGDGSGGTMKNCTPGAAVAEVASDAAAAPAVSSAAAGGAIHAASSPYGPFLPYNPATYPSCAYG